MSRYIGNYSRVKSESNSSLAYGSSLTITSPRTIKDISSRIIDSNNINKDTSSISNGLKLIQPITQFTSDAIRANELYATDAMKMTVLDNGNFAILYRTSNTWKCQLWDGSSFTQIGSTVTLETSAPTATYHHGDICTLAGNKFCVMWSNSTGGNVLKYAIYDNSCSNVLAATTISTSNGGYHSCVETYEGNILFAYSKTYSQYAIWNTSGVVVESETQLSATGTGRANAVCKLSNNYIVFTNEGASNILRFAILDTSTNPSTVKVSYTTALANTYGTGTYSGVFALPNKNFVIIANDETANLPIMANYQYSTDTSWISVGSAQPFTNAVINYYPTAIGAGDLSQEMILIGYPMPISNNGYGPAICIMEGENAKTTKYGTVRGFLPYSNQITSSNAGVNIQILKNKKIIIFWRDTGDSNKGKFVVYQISHFKQTVSGLTVTLTNYTGTTQNTVLSLTY